MTDTRTLERIAKRLTGKTVFVRRMMPARSGTSGQVCKDSRGVWYVDIDPDLTGEKLAYVLLHECAHVVLGHITEPNDQAAHGAPGSIPPPKLNRFQEAAYQARERAADAKAAEWQAWMAAHGGRLESLLDWWPPEYAAAIDRGVERALRTFNLNRR